MSKRCVFFLVAFLFTFYGCATVYNPATGKKEFLFVTTPVEVSLGKTVAAKIAEEYDISNDPESINRLKEIGEKIVQVCDRKDLKYHFYVIEEDTLNAFTTPGGYIYLNSGLMEEATDDELACVVGHEVAHVVARHAAKKLQSQIGYDILMNIAMRKGNAGDLQKAASISYNLIMLGYSRQDELLADRLGVTYAYKAGYDPYAMTTFLEKLKAKNNKEIGIVFLRSHPYTSQRIKMLNTEIPAIIDKVDNKIVYGNLSDGKINLTAKSQSGISETRPLKVRCPGCGKIFSGKTNYCPYDGMKLQ